MEIAAAVSAVGNLRGIISSVLLIASGTLTIPPSGDVSAYGLRSLTSDNWATGRILEPMDSPGGRLIPGGFVWQGEGKGAGISVYVVDSGVDDIGIFKSLGPGYHSFGSNSEDCGKGHGTYVASIIAGAGYGVAESATIISVRVLNCRGSGAKMAVVKGLQWILAHAQPATSVVNISFGGKKDKDIDKVVAQLSDRGIPVVIAAGNSDQNTDRFSPSRTGCDQTLSIVVAASTEGDSPWTGSNYGACVSIYAPGAKVLAFGSQGPVSMTGTSFAAPYVAGAIAAYASEFSVTTQEAWHMVIGQSSSAINVGKRIDTTTRLLHMFSADELPLSTPPHFVSAQ